MLALKISAEESGGAAAQSSTSVPSETPQSRNMEVMPDEQYRILQQIREEQERKDLELALKVSQSEQSGAGMTPSDSGFGIEVPGRSSALDTHHTARDFLISQQKAMEEYERNRAAAASSSSANRNERQAYDGQRHRLLERGTQETQEAIASGRAHIVKCRNCGAKLQAPVSYSLVYCPRCQTVSPA
jgi:hypothetical protein